MNKFFSYITIVGKYFFTVITALFFGFPLLWMVFSSLKTNRELLTNIWAPSTHPTFQSYISIISTTEFDNFFLNSVIITATSVFLLAILSSMTAYIFARFQFHGKNLIYFLFLIGMMIPPHIVLLPLYILFRGIGLLNHLICLLLPYIGFGLPASIFILRIFFEEVPTEIDDAARIDGVSFTGFFWRILLPISKPAISTIIIVNIINIWNEYLFALTLISGNNQSYTLPLGVLSLVKSFASIQYNKAFSALTLSALPVLLIFFILNKRIIKNLVLRSIS